MGMGIGATHPRHVAMLDDDALLVLAVLFKAMERLGATPRQIAILIVVLLPKPKGGSRPITLFATIFKIWARGRRNYAEEWRRRHDAKHFACGPG